MTSPLRTVTNWSELDSDLLSEIANRINCLRDFIIFGGVCRSWPSVASPENFNKSTKAPWLLLDQDKFLNLSKDVIYSINVPEDVIYSHSKFLSPSKHVIYTFAGWFLMVKCDLLLTLLNPFSLSRIDLPLNLLFRDSYIINFALSSSPTVTSDFTIMIIYYKEYDSETELRLTKLVFWKNKDRKWTDVDLELYSFDAIITYHHGRFYSVNLVDDRKRFVVHEIDTCNRESVSVRSKSFMDLYPSMFIREPFWVVGSSRVLMIVTWRLDHECIDGTIFGDLYLHCPRIEFLIQEIDFEKGECKRVSDLGDESLFLGHYSSFLVDVSSESRFKSNHIYFAENFQHTFLYESRGSVGVYNMIDGSYEPLFSEANSGYCCSSQWIEPRL